MINHTYLNGIEDGVEPLEGAMGPLEATIHYSNQFPLVV